MGLNRVAGVVQNARGLDLRRSDPSPDPSFFVFSVRSVVDPPDSQRESNRRAHKGRRKSLDFDGVAVSSPDLSHLAPLGL